MRPPPGEDGFTRLARGELKGHDWLIGPMWVARDWTLSIIRRLEVHDPPWWDAPFVTRRMLARSDERIRANVPVEV